MVSSLTKGDLHMGDCLLVYFMVHAVVCCGGLWYMYCTFMSSCSTSAMASCACFGFELFLKILWIPMSTRMTLSTDLDLDWLPRGPDTRSCQIFFNYKDTECPIVSHQTWLLGSSTPRQRWVVCKLTLGGPKFKGHIRNACFLGWGGRVSNIDTVRLYSIETVGYCIPGYCICLGTKKQILHVYMYLPYPSVRTFIARITQI